MSKVDKKSGVREYGILLLCKKESKRINARSGRKNRRWMAN